MRLPKLRVRKKSHHAPFALVRADPSPRGFAPNSVSYPVTRHETLQNNPRGSRSGTALLAFVLERASVHCFGRPLESSLFQECLVPARMYQVPTPHSPSRKERAIYAFVCQKRKHEASQLEQEAPIPAEHGWDDRMLLWTNDS